MKLKPLLLIAAVGAQLTIRVSAAEDLETIDALKRELEALDQKVRVLERKQELDKDAAAEKAKQVPTVSLGSGGFSVTSPDSNFVFKVRGYVQADARAYISDQVDTAANDSFLIRRARPIFEGTVYDKFDYRVMLDFGAQSSLSTANNALLQDAYVTARLWPELQTPGRQIQGTGGPRTPAIGSEPAIHRTSLPDTTPSQPRRWFPGPGRSVSEHPSLRSRSLQRGGRWRQR